MYFSVIVPIYGTESYLRQCVDSILAQTFADFEVILVDDGSPDGTGAIVKERQAEFPDRLFLLERSGKLGLGTAYIEGFRWALARPYDAVFEMDCDFSHNPDDLVRLSQAAA